MSKQKDAQIDTQIKDETPMPVMLLKMISGIWTSQTIYIAAKLGIADLLKDGSKSSEELAESAGANAEALYRVLRALEGIGIFAERTPGFFELTPLAQYLRTDAQGSMRAAAILIGEDWHHRSWGNALRSVKTGQTAFSQVFGEEIFPFFAHNEQAAKIFNEAMTGLSAAHNDVIAAAYDFSKLGRVVDIGGGHGTLIATILKSNPSLRGTLFDQPSVVEGAKPQLEALGLLERCEVVGGDFFDAAPRGGDVYLLKYIIHDWDDERALGILKTCHSAMEKKSRILLIEQVIQPGSESSFAKLMDIEMLVFSGGRERTGQEYGALLAAAGFEMTNIIPTQAELSMIEAVKR